jgi:hypothetical protein
VKFDDGAESIDLDTQDIMMQDQYQAWLKDLEQYYSLPVPEEISSTCLAKNARVYAKWIDPTDPELNGCWMPGKVHNSKTWEGDDNQWCHSYHIVFDNGDQDEDLAAVEVLPKESYATLLNKKMERGRNKPRLCGFDLIAEASKLSSPIKPVKTIPNRHHDDKSAVRPTIKESHVEGSDASEEGSHVDELCCDDVLESRDPIPSHVGRISTTPSPDVHSPSPDVHYGIYMESEAADGKASIAATKQEHNSNAIEINDENSILAEEHGHVTKWKHLSHQYKKSGCLRTGDNQIRDCTREEQFI